MQSQLWQRATPHLDAGLTVVGWYHSHLASAPFSAAPTGRRSAPFREPYSLGLVIDPGACGARGYAGPDSAEPGFDVRVAPSLAPLDAPLPRTTERQS
jgi:proteasome lid subunit RPN8/RPN11